MHLPLIVPKLAGIGAALIVYYLCRQGRKPAAADPVNGERILRYPWLSHLLGWGLLGFAAVLVGAGLILPAPADAPRINAVSLIVGAFFASLSLYWIVEANGARIVLSDETMTSHSSWRLPRTLAWTDVTDVSFHDRKQVFVVKGQGGEVIRVPTMFLGTRDLAERLRAKVPAEVYANAAAHEFFSTGSHSSWQVGS